MAIRWQLRRVAAAVAAVAGAAALAGCQADDGPIEVTEGTISQDVHVTTSARVADDGIWWDYVLENDSGEDVWIVEPTAAFAVRDRSVPDGVALERLVFEDLGDGRTRLAATSLVDSFEGRDAFLASGMEDGVRQIYKRLDQLLAG